MASAQRVERAGQSGQAGRTKTVLLLMGSVRAGRICPQITAWVERIGRACTDLANLTYETVDLADWRLPMDDEPALPALGTPGLSGAYAQNHTRAWSERIENADAVVFVVPQYNWGYPAVLKNAIDHLYHEWRDKPVAIVTYGGHGGTRCAKQLRQVAASVKMRVVPVSPAIHLPEAAIRQGAAFGTEHDFLRAFAPYQIRVERALVQLAALIDGNEAFWTRMRRKWKNALAVIV